MIEDLENRFVYHAINKEQAEIMKDVRTQLLQIARYMDTWSLDSREKSVAITKLEEAMMWFNAGVARNVRPQVFQSPSVDISKVISLLEQALKERN